MEILKGGKTENKQEVKKETESKGLNKENSVEMFKDGKKNLSLKVTRKELIEILQQIADNMNQSNQYLIQDVNTLYSKHVFPVQIQMQVLLDLLDEKGIIKKEEVDKKYSETVKEMLEKAKAIKEDKDGNLKVLSKEETEKEEKTAVLKAQQKK